MAGMDFITKGYDVPGPKDDEGGPASKLSDDEYNNGIRSPLLELKAWNRTFGTASFNPWALDLSHDGLTDDSIKLQALTDYSYVSFPRATYIVNNNLTFNGFVDLSAAPVFIIASGKKITFNGGSTNVRAYIIQGAGTAEWNPLTQECIYPEMFGAIPGGVDCLPGLLKAHSAFYSLDLAKGDYHLTGRWLIDKQIKLRGKNKRTTRLIIDNTDGDGLTIGSDTEPVGGISSYVADSELSDLTVLRVGGPNTKTTKKDTSAGLHLLYCKRTTVRRVLLSEHAIGLKVEASVETAVEDTLSYRSVGRDLSSPGGDFFRGFYLRGDHDIGLAGGNGSTALRNCAVLMEGELRAEGASAIDSVGVLADEAFADLTVDGGRFAGVQNPVDVGGRSAASSIADRRRSNGNLTIKNCEGETFTKTGIVVHDTSEFATVTVNANSMKVGSTNVDANAACYAIQNGRSNLGGQFTLSHNKADCQLTKTTRGIYVGNISGVQSFGNQVLESQRPIELAVVQNSYFRDSVHVQEAVPTQAAFLAATVNGVGIAPLVRGPSNAYPFGVDITGTSDKNEINCTGLIAAAITSAQKLRVGGVVITAKGTIAGTATEVTGVMT